MVEVKIELLDKGFQDYIKKVSKQVNDFTIPYTLMIQSWYKSNKAIFSLKSPGKYEDFKYGEDSKYKKYKIKKFGFAYPLLTARRTRSGGIEKSLTNGGDKNAIAKIQNKKELVLGTSTEYARYLHEGTKFMEARPLVLIGAEQVALDEIKKRRDLWIKTIENYVAQVVKQ